MLKSITAITIKPTGLRKGHSYMNDDKKMDFSANIDAARKKRVQDFKLNYDFSDNAENDLSKSQGNKVEEIFSTAEMEKANSEGNTEEISEKNNGFKDKYSFDAHSNSETGADNDSTTDIMANDFSEKYSLHRYTEAEEIEESEQDAQFVLNGEERADADNVSDEISSFSNAEQRNKMYREERKALREYKKSEKARKKAKAEKNGCMFRFIWLCMVVAIATVLGVYLWTGMSDLLGISRPSDGDTVILDVPENATFDQIVDMLLENNLIKEEGFFRLYATITNSTEGFEEDLYSMRPNMDYEEILTMLQSGNSLTETVTVQFKEGMSVMEIAEALEDKKVCKATKFMEFCNSDEFDDEYEFLADIKKNENCVYKLEGYLFPDTYEFYIGEDADDTVRRFLDNFEYKIFTRKTTVSGYTEAVSIADIIEDKGMVLNDVINMASLVQAEAANINDMYVVSSVFYNRLDTLDTGGVSPYGDYDLDKLKSDATLYYPYSAQDDIPQDIVATFKSNYNTYNISGLPPGAICNPGLDAIDAAVNPDYTYYYYFCHKAPTDTEAAEPFYASTFSEHEVNLVAAGLA